MRDAPVVLHQTCGLHRKMVRSLIQIHIVLATIYAISCESSREGKKGSESQRNQYYDDNSLWKKEYEAELTDAMISSRKRGNLTRVEQAASFSDNEAVIDKIMETLTNSEKYLKKVDSIDFRLNRLDIEVHEKTNNILKQLVDMTKMLRGGFHSEKVDDILERLKTDVIEIKSLMNKLRGGESPGKIVLLYLLNRNIYLPHLHNS